MRRANVLHLSEEKRKQMWRENRWAAYERQSGPARLPLMKDTNHQNLQRLVANA